MKKLSSKDLQILLISNMGYEPFDLEEMWDIYQDIIRKINTDRFVKFESMQRDSFRRKLKAISDVEGSWLIIEETIKGKVYRMKEPEFSDLYITAMKILQRSRERCSWVR